MLRIAKTVCAAVAAGSSVAFLGASVVQGARPVRSAPPGILSVAPGELPAVGQLVRYDGDGEGLKWEVAKIVTHPDGLAVLLRRGEDQVIADMADVR